MLRRILLSNWTFYIFAFLFFFVYYSQIHPVVPFDTDDWVNAFVAKPLYPVLWGYNPPRVFPPFIQPLTAMFAAYVITPIVGDYIYAHIYANAIVIALFIIAYLYSAQRLLEAKFNLSKICRFCIILLFALLHFLILRNSKTGNDHLFNSYDVTGYYHYIIPNLLAASLVMWLLRHDYKKIESTTRLALFYIVTYFVVFSNLYPSVLFIAFVGTRLILDLADSCRKGKGWFVAFLRQNVYHLSIIVCWGIAMLLEATGPRASWGLFDVPFLYSLGATLKMFLAVRPNVWFLVITLLAIVWALILYRRDSRQPIARRILLIALPSLLAWAYIILMSSRVQYWYVQRGDIMFPYAFYYLMAVLLGFGYLASKQRSAKILLPILCLFAFFEIQTRSNVYKEVQYLNGVTAGQCIDFDRSFVQQVLRAEATGQDTAYIDVPHFDNKDNWPLSHDSEMAFGRALYKHNIISRPIETVYREKNQ